VPAPGQVDRDESAQHRVGEAVDRTELGDERVGVVRGHERAAGSARPPLRLVLAGEGSRPVEGRELGALDHADRDDAAVAVQPQHRVAPRRVDVVVPDLEVAALLDVDVEVLAGEARLGLPKRGRDGVAESAGDGLLGELRPRPDRGVVDLPDQLVAQQSLELGARVDGVRVLGQRLVDVEAELGDRLAGGEGVVEG
jgi:hypothetical protein